MCFFKPLIFLPPAVMCFVLCFSHGAVGEKRKACQAFFTKGEFVKKPLKDFLKNLKSAQNTGFLHITSPPPVEESTQTIVKALKFLSRQHKNQGQIALVIAHQWPLLKQLSPLLQSPPHPFNQALKKPSALPFHLTLWHNTSPAHMARDIKKAASSQKTTVFLAMGQELQNQLQEISWDTYDELARHIQWVFFHRLDHLKLFDTEQALLKLVNDSEAFVYGTSKTPDYKHWLKQLPLNRIVLFQSPSSTTSPPKNKTLLKPTQRQNKENLLLLPPAFTPDFPNKEVTYHFQNLKPFIQKKTIPLLNEIFFLSQSNFSIPKGQSLFLKTHNGGTTRMEMHPRYYDKLFDILKPVFKAKKRGVIVMPSTLSAHLLKTHFKHKSANVVYTIHDQNKSDAQKRKTLLNTKKSFSTPLLSKGGEMPSHYTITTPAFVEELNHKKTEAYINLNTNNTLKHRLSGIHNMQGDVLLLVDFYNLSSRNETLAFLNFLNPLHKKTHGVPHTALNTHSEKLKNHFRDRIRWHDREPETVHINTAKILVKRVRRIHSPAAYQKWVKYRKPYGVPLHPDKVYKDFKGWADFLNLQVKETELSKSDFRTSFNQARKLVRSFGFLSREEFRQAAKTQRELVNIPIQPERYYQKDWTNWEDFLGKTPVFKPPHGASGLKPKPVPKTGRLHL